MKEEELFVFADSKYWGFIFTGFLVYFCCMLLKFGLRKHSLIPRIEHEYIMLWYRLMDVFKF